MPKKFFFVQLTLNAVCFYAETILTGYFKSQMWLLFVGWAFLILFGQSQILI